MRNGPRIKKPLPSDLLALNLDYAFNRGFDLKNRVIQLTEDLDDHHFDFFDTCMTWLEQDNKKTITIKINSYGGDVYTALAIVGRMFECKGARIHTKGYGKIMSAATLILAAGDKRSISRIAEFMHHEPSYDPGHARLSEHEDLVKQSQSLSERWCSLMCELTGIPKQFWMQHGRRVDHYLTPEKCQDLNIVDEVF